MASWRPLRRQDTPVSRRGSRLLVRLVVCKYLSANELNYGRSEQQPSSSTGFERVRVSVTMHYNSRACQSRGNPIWPEEYCKDD